MLKFLLLSCSVLLISAFAYLPAARTKNGGLRIKNGGVRIKNGGLKMATEEATFGMGCFWAPQKTFDKVNGVLRTRVGYTGGSNPNPTYKSVCGGDGHYEAVRVEFDDTGMYINVL